MTAVDSHSQGSALGLVFMKNQCLQKEPYENNNETPAGAHLCAMLCGMSQKHRAQGALLRSPF
jgi:hypothetical protein